MGDCEGQSGEGGGPFSPTGNLQKSGGPIAHIKAIQRVATVGEGVVFKLQLICMRQEHRWSDDCVRGQEPEPWGMEKTVAEGLHGHSDRRGILWTPRSSVLEVSTFKGLDMWICSLYFIPLLLCWVGEMDLKTKSECFPCILFTYCLICYILSNSKCIE